MDRIALSESRAAKALDMPVREFRELVEAGSLPSPKILGKEPKWSYKELDSIFNGVAMSEEFEP